jgi:RNA polymerase sigma factor (sigma-70 family)
MSNEGSVTNLIEELRSQDALVRNEAADVIWKRYSCQLLELARQRLAPRIRRREDEEDVVLNMYDSFCRRMHAGEFSLDNRDDLWNLLFTMTVHKVRKTARKHMRLRRSVSSEQHDESPGDESAGGAAVVGLIADQGPNPALAVELTDMLERLLLGLPDSRMRSVVIWKLEGQTNEQISEKLHCAVRTVERKLHFIREKWAQAAVAG